MAKILVIEDESQLSELFKKILTHYVHQVLIVHYGAEGKKALINLNPI
jgi:DNA-binding response OmpR family regulator